MAERFNPDDWIRFTPEDLALLREALMFQQIHDKQLDQRTRMALVRLSNQLLPPDPIPPIIGDDGM